MAHINSNLTELVFVDTEKMAWKKSGMPGREIKILEQFGRRSVRVSGLVRYAPGFRRTVQTHPYGSEAFVLKGALIDEDGCHTSGTYLRGPGGISRTLSSKIGAVLFFKQGHIPAYDSSHRIVKSHDDDWIDQGNDHIKLVPLTSVAGELTRLTYLKAGAQQNIAPKFGGTEIFIISGETTFDVAGEIYSGAAGMWLRIPHLTGFSLTVLSATTCFVKSGHLHF